MAEKFTVTDRRGSRTPTPGRVKVSRDFNADMNKLRQAGHTLPNSPTAARAETARIVQSVDNKTLTSEFSSRRARTANQLREGGITREAANVQLALPKVRKPMSSLEDKGIPFETDSDDSLKEIRRWARLFYTTHDLVPLLIDIYSKFPIIGMEFDCKDPKVKEFYEDQFMNTLQYEDFLQDFGREYWTVGEVNSLGHFSDTLGIWSSEEILNPDSLRVSRPMFGTSESEQPSERVQLLVKEMVDALRGGPEGNNTDLEMTETERMERNYEYRMLVEHYPEMIDAAARGDGMDISDVLISRVVNKVKPWDTRGTPHLMRSFRTLMMEESLNAAQDAVADRLYSPLILATLGIANLGDDAGPWIPDQGEIDNTRDNLQAALAADFRLMVHHFGLDIKSVFGRESVPRFDQDYSRIDKKLMQAWGIGEALISGGTGTTNYASTALNREFVTQMMLSYQKKARKHMMKRAAVMAEAQGFIDYEEAGGTKRPLYREVVEIDQETGEEYLRKVPKLMLPDIRFQSLNLRDEAQERSFLQQLKSNGFPISDHSLAINVPIEFEKELDRKSEETVDKYVAEAQAMAKAYKMIEENGWPMPPDVAKFMAAQTQLDREKAMADQAKANANKAGTDAETGEMAKDQFAETGVMPGAAGAAGEGAGGGPNDMDNGVSNSLSDADAGGSEGEGGGDSKPKSITPRNRTRPAESDEQRSSQPKAASLDEPTRKVRFGKAPSSHNASRLMDEQHTQEALLRLEAGLPTVHDVVASRDFYSMINDVDTDYETDWPEIEAFHHASEDEQAKAEPEIREAHTRLEESLEQYEAVSGVRPLWV